MWSPPAVSALSPNISPRTDEARPETHYERWAKYHRRVDTMTRWVTDYCFVSSFVARCVRIFNDLKFWCPDCIACIAIFRMYARLWC